MKEYWDQEYSNSLRDSLIFKTLWDADRLVGHEIDYISDTFKGILGSIGKGVRYSNEYNWIFDLVFEANKKYFGKTILQLKYPQNEIVEPCFEGNIYDLFKYLIDTFNNFKNKLASKYYKYEDVKFEFDEYEKNERCRNNQLTVFYINQKDSKFEIERQYKNDNFIDNEISMIKDSDFLKYFETQKTTDYFMIEVNNAFCIEAKKKLFFPTTLQNIDSLKSDVAKNPTPNQKKFLKAFVKNLTDGYKVTYAIETACESSKYSKKHGYNIYKESVRVR